LLVVYFGSFVVSRHQESAHFLQPGDTKKARNGFRSPPSVAAPSLLLLLRFVASETTIFLKCRIAAQRLSFWKERATLNA